MKNCRPHHQRSAVLIITLCMLVLLSIVVLAFFSTALLNRQISFSSAGQARAQMVGLSALDILKGQFLLEMQAGSAANSTNGQNIFIPYTSASVVPYRLSTNVPGISNLVTWSAGGSNFWQAGTGYRSNGPALVPSSTNDSTLTASVNGRYIDPTRWNRPDYGSYPAAALPNWVLLSRSGISSTTNISLMASSTPANTNFVVGRFAYTVYDESGLLDTAAAGYPASASANAWAKGSLGYADLSQILTNASDASTLVNWRNSSTAASPANYSNYLSGFAPLYGFMRAAPGDSGLVGRQDLIQFWTSQLTTSTNFLQYFTTFTREKNAPSWAPLLDANAMGGNNNDVVTTTSGLGTATNSAYSYYDNADSPGFANRRLYNVLVTKPFTRLDGTQAVVGEPLIKERFDLSKLSWLSYNNQNGFGITPPGFSTATAAATAIYNYFGLTLNIDGSWTYNHTSPGGAQTASIMTLDQVAAAGREPDYFELLQAGILQGSLGLCNGDPANADTILQTSPSSGPGEFMPIGGEFYRRSGSPSTDTWVVPLARTDTNGNIVYAQQKYQVMQIGANIIDQAHADGFPTDVVLNGEHFYGIQNLPYIFGIGATMVRASSTDQPSSPAQGGGQYNSFDQAFVHQWMTVSLWNPHQNATTPNTNGPTMFRVYVGQGEVSASLFNTPSVMPYSPAPPWDSLPVNFSTTPSWIQFPMSKFPNCFSEPTPLGTTNVTAYSTTNNAVTTPSGWSRAGIYLGYTWSPDMTNKVPQDNIKLGTVYWSNSFPKSNNLPADVYCAGVMSYSPPPVVDLQYLDAKNGTWHTYQELRGVVFQRNGRGDSYFDQTDPIWSSGTIPAATNIPFNGESFSISLLDPRTPRLNMADPAGSTLTSNADYAAQGSGGQYGPHFPDAIPAGTGGYTEAWSNWVNNNSVANSYYTDRDSVLRPGDANGWSAAGGAADPEVKGAAAQRPIMLNRPFRSVGEMGYASRDDNWKTLNFMTTNSADAGLLDLFCIGPSANGVGLTNAPPSVVAGKVNINSAPLPVLESLISGAARDTAGTNDIISASDIQNLASTIMANIQTNGPMMNKAQVPGAFPQTTAVTSYNPGNKAQREAMIRAVADSANTRTWNLMFDVIAQSGRFKPTAASYNDFVVEGEKRYWLHVAIDRFTGQIVDQQLEPVSEQ